MGAIRAGKHNKMKIRVLPRIFFENIKGTAEEDRLLESYRIVSINSSRGYDSVPPFSERNRNHPNLLRLNFDDVCSEAEEGDCIPFSTPLAEAVMRFADDGSMPMLVHCSAGVSRSGAVGEILDWYFNRFLTKNEADHLDFCRNNRQIVPNPLVREIMLKYIAAMAGGKRRPVDG